MKDLWGDDGAAECGDDLLAARFLKQQNRDMLIIASTPAEVIDACLSYQVPVVQK
jgi:predicted Rossmann-fold nucleotide-binding protein